MYKKYEGKYWGPKLRYSIIRVLRKAWIPVLGYHFRNPLRHFIQIIETSLLFNQVMIMLKPSFTSAIFDMDFITLYWRVFMILLCNITRTMLPTLILY